MTITELKSLLSNFQPKLTDKQMVWTLPTDLEHGILTTNIAFILAKELRHDRTLEKFDRLNFWIIS